MAQKDLHTYYADLASKYLSGNADDAEVRELEEWVSADPENKRTFMALKKAWMLAGLNRPAAPPDTEKKWKETAAQLFGPAKVVALPRRRWMAVAAAVALLAVVGAVLLLQVWAGPDLFVETSNTPKEVELQDGSQVILNRASTLAYVYDKKAAVRRAQLTGDAFFDVARDEKAPFVILTRMLEIEVLGTSFYVDARAEQPEVQVIVESGQVAVRHRDQETILEAGEIAVFQLGNRQLEKRTGTDDNYLALKTDTLTFDNAPLNEVVFDINRYYRADIRIGSEELKNCRLSATFTNKSLEAVLKILASSFNLSVAREEGAIVLTGSCAEDR